MFYFTEDCVIGIESLDDDHRYLFSLMERAMRVLLAEGLGDRYEKVQRILEELNDYADQHFAREEAYMKEIRDPELIRQRTQHDFFRQKVCEMQFANIDDDEEQQRVLADLMNFLSKWLYRHIIGSDIMIGKLPPLEEWMLRENPCEFTDEYRTGITLIDAEHQELFRIIEEATKVVKSYSVSDSYDEILQILERLKDYTKEHFQDEEEYMESIGYDGLEAQKRAHTAFVERLESIREEDIDQNPQEYLQELIEFLLGWLVKHILYTDKKIPNQSL